MAKISLRAYLREIEGLIEHGQLDEATAHCKHILQSYPKLIAAYRLLGKAYLEDQRYGDAADVFQRVLSTIPDDFVSQLGMSIIREDEGNLDAAIWHMERAFEVQPYNAAIQDELRRLFQRRDGVEPHKIRLTRGALARMYARGDLYQQAIAELRAAQAEDDQRPDQQILLARMYYLNGNLVEAVDGCSSLLKKLPYCLEANRLLAAILPQTERKDEAKIYQQRVMALDPYLAAAPITATSAENIPENIAVIEKLDYKAALPGSESASQPAWAASLGVSLEGFMPAEEPLPDWMTADDDEAPPAATQKRAGQGAESFEPPSSASRLPWEQPAESEAGLPDWISSPPKNLEETPGSKTPAVTGSLIPPWMKEAGWEPSSGEEEPPASETASGELGEEPGEGIARAELPDWLRAIAPSDLEQESPESDAGLPWEPEAAAAPGEGLPAWLQAAGETAGDEAPAGGETRPTQAGTSIPAGPEEEETMPPAATPAETMEAAAMPADEIPWAVEPVQGPVEEAKPAEQEPAAEPGFDLGDQDAALAWLESLAARQGVDEEELITRPAERSSEIPAWLRDISQEEPETGASEPPVEPAVFPSAEPAGEWLPEETLSGESRPDIEPEGVLPAAEQAGLALPAWLEDLKKEEPVEEQEGVPAEPGIELPDWLKASMQEAPPEPTPEGEPAGAVRGEIPEWLQALSVPQGEENEIKESQPAELSLQEVKLPNRVEALEETPVEPAAVETTEEEQAVPAPGQVPEWLAVLEEPQAEPAIEEPAATEAEQVPEWLAALEEPEKTQAEPAIEKPATAEPGQVPEWLAALEEPEVEPAGEAAEMAEPEPAAAEAPVAPTPEAEGQEPVAMPSFDLGDQDAAFAWLESLALKQGAAEGELFTQPKDRSGEAPSGLGEAASEEKHAGQPTPEEPPAVSSDLADTKPVRIRPAEPQAVEEQAVPPGAEIWPAPEPQLPEAEIPIPVEEEPSEPEPAAAEITPTAEEAQAAETIAAAALFQAVEIPSEPIEEPAQESPQPVQEPGEMPVETNAEAAPAPVESLEPVEAEPEMPGWIADLAAGEAKEWVEEPSQPAEEPAGMPVEKFADAPTAPVESIEPSEAEPEVPAWLADLTAGEIQEEEVAWMPPGATAQAEPEQTGIAMPETPVRETPQEEPLPASQAPAEIQEAPEPPSARQVNINSASLIELESLPGVGFIQAQNILSYRDAHGPFERVEDLLNVPGFNPATLDEIEDRLTTGAPEKISAPASFEDLEPESVDPDQSLLIQARNALIQENVVETVARYSYLIKKERMLDTVIRDLYEALYHFPMDISIWQTLGDAYMRNNQLQEALDAYIKAEELLR